MKLSVIQGELEKMFDLFNDHFFEEKLPKTIISIQSAGKKPKLGWFTLSDEVWKDKEEKEKYFEISISSEYLNRGLEKVSSTLLHEMTHEYNYINGIKDTANNMIYHNKKFKKSAEDHGLIIEKDNRIGYSISELNDESKMFVSTIKIDTSIFDYSRSIFRKPKIENKYKLYTFICPKCNCSIKSTNTEGEFECVPCNKIFELKE